MAVLDIPAHSQGWMLYGLDVFLITMTTIIMIFRMSARGFMTKALGVDDYIAVFAYVSTPRVAYEYQDVIAKFKSSLS